VVRKYLNRGERTARPGTAAYIGDDFLMRQGTTIVWLGWQHDLPAGQGLMRIVPPIVTGIEGLVNGDEVVAAKMMEISLGDKTSITYPATEPNAPENTRASPPPVPRRRASFHAANGLLRACRMANWSRTKDAFT